MLVEELEIVTAVVKRVLHQMLDEVLCQVHIIIDVVECHLRLHHPELCKVSRGVGILRTESRSESVNLTQSGGAEFALELAAHCEAGLFSEEILRIINFSLLVSWDVFEVQGSDLEHLTRSLTVRSSDERGVEIIESL